MKNRKRKKGWKDSYAPCSTRGLLMTVPPESGQCKLYELGTVWDLAKALTMSELEMLLACVIVWYGDVC